MVFPEKYDFVTNEIFLLGTGVTLSIIHTVQLEGGGAIMLLKVCHDIGSSDWKRSPKLNF